MSRSDANQVVEGFRFLGKALGGLRADLHRTSQIAGLDQLIAQVAERAGTHFQAFGVAPVFRQLHRFGVALGGFFDRSRGRAPQAVLLHQAGAEVDVEIRHFRVQRQTFARLPLGALEELERRGPLRRPAARQEVEGERLVPRRPRVLHPFEKPPPLLGPSRRTPFSSRDGLPRQGQLLLRGSTITQVQID